MRPESREELLELLRDAAATGRCWAPRGRATRTAFHPAQAEDAEPLFLDRLNRVLWIDPEDRTCAVEAGLGLRELDQALAEHELMLPFWDGSAGTVGGAFLSGCPSLAAARTGAPRDQVLGGEWLLADGRAIRTGSRVVKSVAGYDLTRLLIGSRGRLALCVALILRLRPRPPHWSLLADPAPDAPAPRGHWLDLERRTGDGATRWQLWADPAALPAGVQPTAEFPGGWSAPELEAWQAPLAEVRQWVFADAAPSALTASAPIHERGQRLLGLTAPVAGVAAAWPPPDSPRLPELQAVFAGAARAFTSGSRPAASRSPSPSPPA